MHTRKRIYWNLQLSDFGYVSVAFREIPDSYYGPVVTTVGVLEEIIELPLRSSRM
jgi:hypothetical protein